MHSSTPPPPVPQLSDEPSPSSLSSPSPSSLPPPPPLPSVLPPGSLAARFAEVRGLSDALHAYAVGANSAERLLPRRNLRRNVIRMSYQLCDLLDLLQPEITELEEAAATSTER